MSKKIYYKLRLSDKDESWDYNDDYSRPVRFYSSEIAAEWANELFEERPKLESITIVSVSEEAVANLTKPSTKIFDRTLLEEIARKKINAVNDEAGYRAYLEVPEMVEIIASSIEELLEKEK